MKELNIIITLLFVSLKLYSQNDSLLLKIEQFTKDKNATIGFAMIGIEDDNSLSFNGMQHFPMQSV